MAGRKRIYDLDKLKPGQRQRVRDKNVMKFKHQYANYHNKTGKVKVRAVTEGEGDKQKVFFEALQP